MGLFPKDRDLTQPPREVELPVRASDWQERPAELKVRLDAFLARFLRWRSRASLQGLIHEGYVLVAAAAPERPGATLPAEVERRPGRRLLHGSMVTVRIPESLQADPPPTTSAELEVLWEDAFLVAVDKPPDVPVHPSGRHLTDTLIQRVHARYQGQQSGPEAILKLCHRLDKETSGAILVARERGVHAAVMSAFEQRLVEKEYLAIVHGVPERDEGEIDLPLGSSRTSRISLKMAVRADGLPSRTSWRVVERARDCALLAIRLHTGRQHQIRVHMEAIGHPLVGDKLYGVEDEIFLANSRGELSEEQLDALGLPRQALHNHRLALRHPRTREWLEIVSPLARDMSEYLAQRAL